MKQQTGMLYERTWQPMFGYPKQSCLHLPTPVNYLSNLSDRLGIELYMKRDDLTEFGVPTTNNGGWKHTTTNRLAGCPMPLPSITTLPTNTCGIKTRSYKANIKKNATGNGHSKHRPNGIGVISVTWTLIMPVQPVKKITVITNKNTICLLRHSTGYWIICLFLFPQTVASIRWMPT